MRNLLIYSCISITCLFLVACQSIEDEEGGADSSKGGNKQVNSEGEENAMNQVDILILNIYRMHQKQLKNTLLIKW